MKYMHPLNGLLLGPVGGPDVPKIHRNSSLDLGGLYGLAAPTIIKVTRAPNPMRTEGSTAMTAIGEYDKELQMFCDTTREADLAKLGFLRWLAEQGKLEHEVFGESWGEYTQSASLELSV